MLNNQFRRPNKFQVKIYAYMMYECIYAYIYACIIYISMYV